MRFDGVKRMLKRESDKSSEDACKRRINQERELSVIGSVLRFFDWHGAYKIRIKSINWRMEKTTVNFAIYYLFMGHNAIVNDLIYSCKKFKGIIKVGVKIKRKAKYRFFMINDET